MDLVSSGRQGDESCRAGVIVVRRWSDADGYRVPDCGGVCVGGGVSDRG